MAGLSFKVGADVSGLARGLTRAKGMVGGFGRAVKGAGLAGLAIGAAGATAGLVAMGAAARGVKSAIDMGGELSDLSSRTGVAVRDLVILQRAFQDNGIAAEKLGPIINKMQKGITDFGSGLSTQVRAFERLGIAYQDIEGMDPAAQFAMLQKSISAIEDPTLRTATAMEIFGRSGGELQALFADAGAMGKAAVSVGEQADILDRNAAAFDRSADLLAGMGAKLKGLFVGMADFINPILLPLLEELNKIDLAAWGQQIGGVMGMIYEAFKTGELLNMAGAALKVGFKEGVNVLWVGVRGVAAFLGASLLSVVRTMITKFRDADFWSGVKEMFEAFVSLLKSAFYGIRAELSGGENDRRLAKNYMTEAGINMNHGMTLMGDAGNGKGVGAVVSDALSSGGVAFSKAVADAGKIFDTAGDSAKLERMMGKLQAAAAARRQATNDQVNGTAKNQAGIVKKVADGLVQAVKPQVSAMQRVGGASLSRAVVGLDVERNQLLREVARNTRGGNVARYA